MIKYTRPKLYYTLLFFKCLATGQWKRLYREAYYRVYLKISSYRFSRIVKFRERCKSELDCTISNPVAVDSLDNIHPKGALTSICNKGFLLEIEKWIWPRSVSYLDLGCAQGALVKSARQLGWRAYGVDGASVTRQDCSYILQGDITKSIQFSGYLNLITAWEVLEHIPKEKLENVFNNIVSNLAMGGYFIASTSDEAELHDGVDLHVTKMTNKEWKAFIYNNFYRVLQPVDLKLKPHQYARQNFKNPSFLVYKRI